MATIWRAVAFAALFLLIAVPHASADPVKITGGFMVLPGISGTGTISITGTRGFTVEAEVYPGAGGMEFCLPCAPNAPLSVGGILAGDPFRGSFTLDGVLYTPIDTIDSASLFFRLFGGGTTPPFQNQPVMFTVPFTLTGFINLLELSAQPVEGRGTATVTLQPELSGEPLWSAPHVRYDFNDATVPEPATLVLVGSGLAGLLYRRRRGQLHKDPDCPDSSPAVPTGSAHNAL